MTRDRAAESMKVNFEGTTCYIAWEPDEFGNHHGQYKHMDVDVYLRWNEDAKKWEEAKR